MSAAATKSSSSTLRSFFSFRGRLNWKSFAIVFFPAIILFSANELFAGLLSYPFIRPEDQIWYERTGELPPVYNTFRFIVIGIGVWLTIAASVKRLHDTGTTGWVIIVGIAAWFLPDMNILNEGIGPILKYLPIWGFGLWFISQKGDQGPNKYGPPPDDRIVLNPQ